MELQAALGLVALSCLAGGGMVWFVMRTRREAIEDRLRDRTVQVDTLSLQLEKLRQEHAELDRAFAAERSARNVERRADQEKIDALKDAQSQWLTEIDAMSRRALDRNSQSFIDLAKGQFEQLMSKASEKGEHNRLQIEQLVQPLGKSLEAVNLHLSAVEKDRTEAYAALTQQVKQMSEAQLKLQKEASNLVTALRKPSVRGRWGEVQLRRVVELAGMVAYCDFEEQPSVQTADGRLRPDLLVRLPGDRIIVVDAKVPLEAYLESVEAEDEAVKAAELRRHVQQIREHIRKLSAKAYHDQFDTTPDMVVMFLPGESFFYAAMQTDPTLFEYGIDNNVIVATPMTFIALLRAVAYGWRQEQVADNARKISSLGQELYDRICTLAEHIGKVGSGLSTALGSYNRAVGTLESRVLVSARRFKELGSGSSKEVPVVEPVDSTPRLFSSPELRATQLHFLGDGGEPLLVPGREAETGASSDKDS